MHPKNTAITLSSLAASARRTETGSELGHSDVRVTTTVTVDQSGLRDHLFGAFGDESEGTGADSKYTGLGEAPQKRLELRDQGVAGF